MEKEQLQTKDFRSYLKDEFEKRLAKNPSYSLRAFAKHLEIDPGTLSRIINNKRKLNKSLINKIATGLGLSSETANYFQTDEENCTVSELDRDTFMASANWYYDAILELTHLSCFKANFKWIAQTLEITEKQVTMAVDRLVRLGLLSIDGDNWQDCSFHNSYTSPYITDLTKINYQKQILEKAIVALDSVPRDKREQHSVTMSIDSSDLEFVNRKITKFKKDLINELQSTDKAYDSVYQFSLSFFPLTNNQSERSLI